jgi:hypothetical protein
MNGFDSLQTFNPTSYGQLAMGIVFYVALIIVTFFSFATMYVLIKNGRSKVFATFASLIYLAFFLGLSVQAISALNSIK